MTDSDKIEKVALESRIRYLLLTNPLTNEQFAETIEKKANWSSELGFDFYFFEFDWELQRGQWTFEVIYNNEVMCEQVFSQTVQRGG